MATIRRHLPPPFLLVPLLCACALGAAALARPLGAQAPPQEIPPGGQHGLAPRPGPLLSVSGAGEVRVAPDQATVRLGTQAQAPTARAAQEQVNQVTAAILQAITRLGVPAASIQTSELSLRPLYASSRSADQQRITGYQAGNVVAVTLDRLDRIGPVVDAGLTAGANQLEGVSFWLRADTTARAAALAQAVDQARRKAQALAAALRVRLLELAEVEEQGAEPIVPRFKGVQALAMPMAAATPVEAGELTIQAGVVLRYRIGPCPAQGPCDGGR